MKSFIIAAFLSSLALAAPVAQGVAPPGEDQTTAAQNWAQDTGTVSNFLNMAPTLTGADFTAQAKIALAAEKDELNHKAVLDAIKSVTSTSTIPAANNSLVTEGHFQSVVDLLQDMVTNGDSVAIKDTNSINTNRCKNVLPSIDAYLGAAGTQFKATRPTACDEDSVTSLASPAGTAPTSSSTPDTTTGGDTGNQGNQRHGGGHGGH